MDEDEQEAIRQRIEEEEAAQAAWLVEQEARRAQVHQLFIDARRARGEPDTDP